MGKVIMHLHFDITEEDIKKLGVEEAVEKADYAYDAYDIIAARVRNAIDSFKPEHEVTVVHTLVPEDIIDIMERTKPEHSWDTMMGVAVLIDSNEPTNPVRVFLDKEDGAFWAVAEDNTNQYFAHKIHDNVELDMVIDAVKNDMQKSNTIGLTLHKASRQIVDDLNR